MKSIILLLATSALGLPVFAAEDAPNKPATTCTKRHEAGFTALGGKLYLLGGRGIKPVEEYDPVAKTWRKLAPTPMEFHHFQPVVVEDKIAVVGAMTGKYPHETPVPNIWYFNPAANEWTEGPEIPEGRRRGGAGTITSGTLLYLVCGIQDGHWSGFVPWLDCLNTETGEWSILTDAPRPRDHFQSVLLDGKIYAAGGRTSFGKNKQVFDLTIPEVDAYDIAKGTWETLATKLPTPRAGCMATTRDGKLIILGGESMAQPTAHSEIEALTPATLTWETLQPMSTGRHGTGAAFIGDTLYLAAGCAKRGGSPELNTMEIIAWPPTVVPNL